MEFREIKIKDRLPDFGHRIFFYNSNYGAGILSKDKQGFIQEYNPSEKVEVKKGKFVEMKDCQIAKDFLINNFDSWLEPINITNTSNETYKIVGGEKETIASVEQKIEGLFSNSRYVLEPSKDFSQYFLLKAFEDIPTDLQEKFENMEGKYLLLVRFLKESDINRQLYTKDNFCEFFKELKTYTPLYHSEWDDVLYFSVEKGLEVLKDFEHILNKFLKKGLENEKNNLLNKISKIDEKLLNL